MANHLEQMIYGAKVSYLKTTFNFNNTNMTEIIVTLENGADSTLLSKMIENMKGVLKASVRRNVKSDKKERTDEWIRKMTQLSNSMDSSMIDMSDEKTRYIMSK